MINDASTTETTPALRVRAAFAAASAAGAVDAVRDAIEGDDDSRRGHGPQHRR